MPCSSVSSSDFVTMSSLTLATISSTTSACAIPAPIASVAATATRRRGRKPFIGSDSPFIESVRLSCARDGVLRHIRERQLVHVPRDGGLPAEALEELVLDDLRLFESDRASRALPPPRRGRGRIVRRFEKKQQHAGLERQRRADASRLKPFDGGDDLRR